jgi:hypothetical protein
MIKSRPFEPGKMYRSDGMPIRLQERDGALVLADGEVHRTPMMFKDGARPCLECKGRGIWQVVDQNLTCPYCSGSGMVSATGGPAANNTDTARDHASTLSEADRRVLADAEMRARAVGHRSGWAIDSSPEGKAARQKVFDAMAEADEERENAWRTLPSDVGTASSAAAPDQTTSKDHRTTDQDKRDVHTIARDHQANMESIYREHSDYLQNAWRNVR